MRLTKIINRIDELASSTDQSHILMGDAETGASSLKDARKLWSQGKKMDTVDELLNRAGLNAASSGSGGNIENATRQQLKRMLDPKLRRGLSADEQVAVMKAISGTKTQNALRLAGKLSPTTGGLTAMLGGAGAWPRQSLHRSLP
jgi:hypothetical protein